MYLAEISQNWAVVPIVLGAAGYLLVAWRRSTKRGGCCGHASSRMPSPSAPDSNQQARPAPKQFIHADHLAHRASALRKDQDDRASASR